MAGEEAERWGTLPLHAAAECAASTAVVLTITEDDRPLLWRAGAVSFCHEDKRRPLCLGEPCGLLGCGRAVWEGANPSTEHGRVTTEGSVGSQKREPAGRAEEGDMVKRDGEGEVGSVAASVGDTVGRDGEGTEDEEEGSGRGGVGCVGQGR